LELKEDSIEKRENSEMVGAEKGKLFPTDIGRVVNDFLVEQFKDIVDYSFTANIEKELDQVADGTTVWDQMIAQFYKGFHHSVEQADLIDRSKVNSSRDLGLHPESGQRVSVRLGRFGPMVQIGETDTEEKPQFASLRKDQSLATITLEEALELFKLPRTVGEVEGEPIVAASGRFGPYLKFMGKFISLPAGESPFDVTLDRAQEIIEAKLLADANRLIKTFHENKECQVLNGRWGPYVALGKRNLKIPKGEDPTTLTYERVLQLAEEQKDKPVKGKTGAKAGPKAASAATPKPASVAKPKAKAKAKKAAPKKAKK
jgi:DNA topoisomerase-1